MNCYWLLILLASSLIWMVVVEACQMPAYPSPQYPAFPSHGDIRRCASGLVMIYKGPDGTNIEHMWGTFSGTLVGHQEYVENTLCQQLGYADGKLTRGDSSTEAGDYPVWISDVQCDSTYQHILRCDYTDAPNTTKHTDDWYLTCFKIVRPDYAYVGQVALIPPVGISTFSYSNSVGVVVYLKETREWKFIVMKDSSSFDINLADTACRAMGFTHAVWNSVTTVKQYTTSYGGNYSFGDSMNGSSASSVDCSGSFQCIGCCQFNSPKDISSKDYAMVIRCSFYEPISRNAFASGGYENTCGAERQVCESEKVISQKSFIGTVTPLGILLALLVIATVVLSIILGIMGCRTYRRRPEYAQLEGVNDGNGRGGGGGGGGGDGNGDNGGGH